jgi:hypothetical protein
MGRYRIPGSLTILIFLFSQISQRTFTTATTASTTITSNHNNNYHNYNNMGQLKGTKDESLSFLNELRAKYEHQPTFLQALEEMALGLLPLFQDPKQGEFYQRAFVTMAEPERTISFRVPWMDDEGKLRINRGWRVEFSRYVVLYR